MLNLYRRHQPPCQYSSWRYRNCNCPIWVQESLRGEYIRRALDLARGRLPPTWFATGKPLAKSGWSRSPTSRLNLAESRYAS